MSKFNLVKKWFSRSPRPARAFRKLTCEAFEDRHVPAIVVPPFQPVDLAQVAALYPRHEGATNIYLNFDGYTNQYVSPFESTTGDRNRDIQEILFRTAELFAPFDVQVQRILGNGNRALDGGDTTIFIGDKLGNSIWSELPGGGWTLDNNSRAYANSIDGPTVGNGYQTPNSNPYDLAYVDPVSFTASSATGGQPMNLKLGSNASIAISIAHEAGHTFGLQHVSSGSSPTIMSYTAPNRRFLNQSFLITTLNNNGTTTELEPSFQPIWLWNPPGPTPILQTNILSQNAYAYLQATLGNRSLDYANVANIDAVDASYTDGTMPALSWNGGTTTGSVGRQGDFDVFTVSSPTTRYLEVNITTPDSNLDPLVFITNGHGDKTLTFDDDGGTFLDSRVIFRATAGDIFKIAVGGYNGTSTGSYRVTVTPFTPTVNPEVIPGIGGLSNGLPEKDYTPLSIDRTLAPPSLRLRQSFTTEVRSTPATAFNVESDFAPPPAIAPQVSLNSGVLTLVGTNGDDITDVRYVLSPRSGASVSASPTPWIRVTMDTPLGDSVHYYYAGFVSTIDYSGKLGNDSFQNATFIPSRADGGPGDDILFTGNGNDIGIGGSGNDLLIGGDGADFLIGGDHDDFLIGGTGDDHLIGDEIGQVGNDVLIGESGNDILEGRDGDDFLDGGNGRDVLIGGNGRDDLFGGADDDLLLGGGLAFPILGAPLEHISREWTSSHDYGTRVRNLRGLKHPDFKNRLNEDTFLRKEKTVTDDGALDNLDGGTGQDWFVVGPFDTTNAVLNEQLY